MSPLTYLIVLLLNFALGYLHFITEIPGRKLWRSPVMQANAAVLWVYLILHIQFNSIEVFGQVPVHLACTLLLIAPFMLWLSIAFTVAGYAFGFPKTEVSGIARGIGSQN